MDHYLKLRPLLQRFVDAVVETGTAAGAVRKLGRRTCDPRRRGYKLMEKPHVREAVEERRAEAIEEAGISRVRVLQELSRIAFFNIQDLFFEADGHLHLKPVTAWPPEAAAAIAGVDVEALFEGSGKDRVRIGDIRKFKAWPKVDALRTLAQHLKMLTEKHEVTGKDGAPLPTSGPVYIIGREEAKSIGQDLDDRI
jgi:phage terminase small subunit